MTSTPPDADAPRPDKSPTELPPATLRLSEVLDDAHSDIGINPASLPHETRGYGRRRVGLPLTLFLLTCVTTFAAGAYHWAPTIIGFPVPVKVKKGQSYVDYRGQKTVADRDEYVAAAWYEALRFHWRDGLVFMFWVMALLLFHEMGHFLMTLRYKVPASFPFFIPVPFMITGTMGAVIAMDPYKANRKEVFDIGLAGPLAGLLLTIPLTLVGLQRAEPMVIPVDSMGAEYGDPLLVQLLIPYFHDVNDLEQIAKQKETQTGRKHRFTFGVNAIYMAGWVGMLVTGLNMLPVSQLDGGHVLHGLFGRYSRLLARTFLIAAIAFIILFEAYHWILMLVLVIIIGPDHPPTADDTIRIGPWRWILGFVSLAIPLFCFPPFPLSQGGP